MPIFAQPSTNLRHHKIKKHIFDNQSNTGVMKIVVVRIISLLFFVQPLYSFIMISKLSISSASSSTDEKKNEASSSTIAPAAQTTTPVLTTTTNQSKKESSSSSSSTNDSNNKNMKNAKKNQNNNKKKTKNIASEREYGGDASNLIYKSGIPTLRSSAHRVKFDIKGRKHDPKPRDHRTGKLTNTTWLPNLLLEENVFDFDTTKYDLQFAVISLLKSCNPNIVGSFDSSCQDDVQKEGNDNNDARSQSQPLPSSQPDKHDAKAALEDFRIPVPSVWRSVNGGQCESAQKYLSDQVASNESFLKVFDQFVMEVVLPYVKHKLISATSSTTADSDETDDNNDNASSQPSYKFYYQRPPTLRIQPGPGWAKVKPHNDAEYGHQNGELNIWVPLTDRQKTGVDLWSETVPGQEDYHPIPARIGQVISFHGSSRKHYVNPNSTPNSRVSLDFRIGVSGYFDPYWQMKGTTNDHGRKEFTL